MIDCLLLPDGILPSESIPASPEIRATPIAFEDAKYEQDFADGDISIVPARSRPDDPSYNEAFAHWYGATPAMHVITQAYRTARRIFFEAVRRERVQEGRLIMLLGESQSGKTHIVNRFSTYRHLQPYSTKRGETLPIVVIEAKPPATLANLGNLILAKLDPLAEGERTGRRAWERVNALIKSRSVKFLMIDNFDISLNLKDVSARKEVMDMIHHLITRPEWPINVLLTADPGTCHKLISQLTPRLISRPQSVELTPAHPTDDLEDVKAFLETFELQLGLQQPSNLSDPIRLRQIWLACHGLYGAMARLLIDAAVIASNPVPTCIDKRHLSAAFDRKLETIVNGDLPYGNPFEIEDCVLLDRFMTDRHQAVGTLHSHGLTRLWGKG